MDKYTLYMGLNDKDTKTQKIDTVEAYKIAMNILTVYADGATIYNAMGIYKHDDGTVITENTLRIELIDVAKDVVYRAVADLKRVFNQEAIVMQYDKIESIMV